MLKDNYGRVINYLRLAVTDKCNLRCFYCMPAEGIDWAARKELMSYEEMLRICTLLVNMGIEKIRITGGEPFVRKDIMPFLAELSKQPLLKELTLTTNGVLTAPLIPELKRMGIRSINLSLDSIDRERFFAITRRDELPRVLETLQTALKHGMQVKINAVVMADKNIADIIPLVQLTKDLPVAVRFIEEMPFNGVGQQHAIAWDHVRILEEIRDTYPSIQKIPDPVYSTSYNYRIPGHMGSVGIIAAYTRSFCGTCNRLRLTPKGVIKTCLYDGGGLNIKDKLREGLTDAELSTHLRATIASKAIDGKAAESKRAAENPVHESMTTIGG